MPNLMASRLVASHVTNFISASWPARTRVGVTGCGVESNKHTKQQNRELRLVSLSRYNTFIRMSLSFVPVNRGART